MAPEQSFILPTWTLLPTAFLLSRFASPSLGGLEPVTSFLLTLTPSFVKWKDEYPSLQILVEIKCISAYKMPSTLPGIQ